MKLQKVCLFDIFAENFGWWVFAESFVTPKKKSDWLDDVDDDNDEESPEVQKFRKLSK